jgi:hypothetical protein
MDKPDKYHFHEAMDRAHVISCIFHEHIVEHTAVKATPELRAKAEEIAEALWDFYQLCGTFGFEEEAQ